jgi:hypothetical protein
MKISDFYIRERTKFNTGVVVVPGGHKPHTSQNDPIWEFFPEEAQQDQLDWEDKLNKLPVYGIASTELMDIVGEGGWIKDFDIELQVYDDQYIGWKKATEDEFKLNSWRRRYFIASSPKPQKPFIKKKQEATRKEIELAIAEGVAYSSIIEELQKRFNIYRKS